MLLKQAIEEIGGLKYLIRSLDVLSPPGRSLLAQLPFLVRRSDIEQALHETETVATAAAADNNRKTLAALNAKLGQLRDISGTIRLLSEGGVLNDVELFEIKHFALLARSVGEYAGELGFSFIEIPDLLPVIDILDPEKKRIPHFYLYDCYSDQLPPLREKLRQLSARKAAEEEMIEAYREAQQEEDRVRRVLAGKLFAYAAKLVDALHGLARLDVLLAKARQAIRLKLVKPLIGEGQTSFTALFHPQVDDALRQQGKRFQPVDIALPMEPTVITGANMAGKSVLLKSVALAQALAQFGFFVPARSATVAPVDKIVISAGDDADEMKGLSSFAAEMLRLDRLVEDAKRGVSQLVLIDELARTTNPVEGKALVCGMLDFLLQYRVRSLITTHYSIEMPCRKLRVKGFTPGHDSLQVTTANLHDFIDYSLEETTDEQVPHEALKIAAIIGVSDDLLERTRKYLIK